MSCLLSSYYGCVSCIKTVSSQVLKVQHNLFILVIWFDIPTFKPNVVIYTWRVRWSRLGREREWRKRKDIAYLQLPKALKLSVNTTTNVSVEHKCLAVCILWPRTNRLLSSSVAMNMLGTAVKAWGLEWMAGSTPCTQHVLHHFGTAIFMTVLSMYLSLPHILWATHKWSCSLYGNCGRT